MGGEGDSLLLRLVGHSVERLDEAVEVADASSSEEDADDDEEKEPRECVRSADGAGEKTSGIMLVAGRRGVGGVMVGGEGVGCCWIGDETERVGGRI